MANRRSLLTHDESEHVLPSPSPDSRIPKTVDIFEACRLLKERCHMIAGIDRCFIDPVDLEKKFPKGTLGAQLFIEAVGEQLRAVMKGEFVLDTTQPRV